MTGTVLVDRYLLGAVLGQSGLGLVHAAVDLKLRRDVAVKLLGSASADSEQLRRLSREALAAGSLQHPHHWLLPALIGLRMESRRDSPGNFVRSPRDLWTTFRAPSRAVVKCTFARAW